MLTDWIFLYGPPGSGKTAKGMRLASELRLPFLDLDERVENASGHSIPELFAAQGESAFRQLERQTLFGILEGQPGVIALGGGTLLDRDCRAHVEENGPVVCLDSSLPVLIRQVKSSESLRPLLAGDLEVKLANLLEQRTLHYKSFPLQVNGDGLPLAESVWQIQARLGRFHVSGLGDGYDVHVYPGSLDDLGQALQRQCLRAPIILVADEQVSGLHFPQTLRSLSDAGFYVCPVTFPVGEQHKTLATVQSLWDSFLQGGLDRGGTVISLGGGVVSDLVGFASATFMRGVAWVVAPTTLLAMVDASLGGKTGFDLPQGKNLVGAFHSPRLVLVDPQVLSTLSMRELRSGMAEVVKAGIIGDTSLFEACSHGLEAVQPHWQEIIGRSMAVKIRIVKDDPYEQGRRAALNFGHTIGHALESVSNYTISHGEAVAMGMVAEARISERINLAPAGLVGRIIPVLTRLGLPVELPAGITPELLIPSIKVDKKRQAGAVHFALPAAIGDVREGIAIKSTEIIQLLSNRR